MIHEVIILDHSGPDLALILYASAVKFALFGVLVVSILVPRGRFDPWVAGVILLVGLALIAVLVGVIESVMARLRMDRIPQFLVAAAALAGFGVILLLR
jgi:formate hydrogenlyase subunit 4